MARRGGAVSEPLPRGLAVDHLVYAVPDLPDAVAALAARFGVRASAGGRHAGRGTHNALLALGARSYLEIVAPDPSQPAPAGPRWLGVDGPALPRLTAWAAATPAVAERAAAAAAAGVALGAVAAGARERPDGVRLAWTFTDPSAVVAGGVVPFLIDWGDGPHPAASAAPGLSLVGLRAEHPDAVAARGALRALGIELDVRPGAAPGLVATIRSPRGTFELR
jgi:hypothetical protein